MQTLVQELLCTAVCVNTTREDPAFQYGGVASESCGDRPEMARYQEKYHA